MYIFHLSLIQVWSVVSCGCRVMMYKWITSHLLAEPGVWGNIASFHGLRFKPLLKLKGGTLSSSPIFLHRKKVTLVKTRYWLWKMRKIEVTRDMALIFYNTLLLVYHTGNTSLIYLSDCLGTAALRKGLKIMNIHSWLITSCSDCFNDTGFARWKNLQGGKAGCRAHPRCVPLYLIDTINNWD